MNLLFGIWLLSATVQILYLIYFHLAAGRYRDSKIIESEQKPVSIVICAKNEANNLKRNIPFLFHQNYPDFEIIVVDDGSTDETIEILEALSLQDNRLKVFRIENTRPGKKEALTYGIEKASHEWLLLTDADCRPVSLDWISLMIGPINESTEIVLGLGPLNYKNGFMNALQRFENETVALLYAGFSLRGKTYMGVGRNLAYKKSIYQKVGGFESHSTITSGDDDLFISSAADSKNVAVQLAYDARSYSDGPGTWKKWISQKSRHQSTARHYKSELKLLLNTWYLSYVIFFALCGILIVYKCNLITLVLVYICRQSIQYYSLKNLSQGHRIKTNTLALFLYDWTLLVFYFLSTTLLTFRKSDEW